MALAFMHSRAWVKGSPRRFKAWGFSHDVKGFQRVREWKAQGFSIFFGHRQDNVEQLKIQHYQTMKARQSFVGFML